MTRTHGGRGVESGRGRKPTVRFCPIPWHSVGTSSWHSISTRVNILQTCRVEGVRAAMSGMTFELDTPHGRMMAGIAQSECNVLSGPVKSGLAAARARGKKLGRQPGQRSISDRFAPKVLHAIDGGRSYRWIARDLGISKNTVADIVKRHRANPYRRFGPLPDSTPSPADFAHPGPAHGDGNGLRCPEVENVGSSQGLFVELLQGPNWPSGTPRRLIRGRWTGVSRCKRPRALRAPAPPRVSP